jgi:O-antigen ligase
LDHLIEWLVAGLVCFAPWPFGSVHAWAEEVILAFAAAMGIVFLAKLLLVRDASIVHSWTYLPIGLFALLVVFQLIPLPHSVIGILSHNTLTTKARILSDLSGATDGPMAITFYSYKTRHDFRLLLSVVVIFVAAMNVFRERPAIKRVLTIISVAGAAVMTIALAQDLTNTDKIFWIYKKYMVVAVGGPFISHNHYCQFANLTIGAALALLLLISAETRSSRGRKNYRGIADRLTDRHFLSICGLALVILIGAFTVVLSVSRGGIISLFVAGFVIAAIAVIRWRISIRQWMLVPALAAIFAVICTVGFDSVSQKLSTLKHPYEQSVDRLQIVKDICAAWPRFPLFGTGLGTHQYVYPMFEHLTDTPNFDHAENEYAQMLEETGALGLALVLLFIAMLASAFFRATKGGVSSISVAAFGLGVGLLAVAIQSTVDFGQHLLANAVLTAIECALLLNVAHLIRRRTSAAGDKSTASRARGTFSHLRVALVSIGAVALIVVFVIAFQEADRARRADAYWQPIRPIHEDFARPATDISDPQLNWLVESIGAARAIDPDNIDYQYWTPAYKWAQIEKRHDSNADEDVRPDSDKQLVGKLIGDFNQARRLCPSYAQPLYMAGVLQYWVLDRDSGAPLVRLASELAPTDTTISLQVVSIDCNQKKYAEAVEMAKHYLSLSGMLHGDYASLAAVLVESAGRPDLAVSLAGDDPQRLMALVLELRAQPGRPDYQTMAAALQEKASRLRRAQLIELCRDPNASAADLAEMAEIYRSENRLPESMRYYQRALVLNYGQVEWRLHLAQAMLAAGRPNDAVNEAEICLRLKPQSDAAQQVIAAATTQPSYSVQP